MTEKGNYKYSYIPREYYPAVMFAAKMVRENGWFNRACKTAADYYCVDERKVREYLSQRSQDGKKAKPQTKRKRIYFVIRENTYSCEGSQCVTQYYTTYGYSTAATKARLSESDFRFNRAHDTGSYWVLDRGSCIVGEFATPSEAEEEAAKLRAKEKRKK